MKNNKKLLEECKVFLDYFKVDYSSDTIELNDRGMSMVMNNSDGGFADKFVGYSINSIAEYTAKELGKKTKYRNE